MMLSELLLMMMNPLLDQWHCSSLAAVSCISPPSPGPGSSWSWVSWRTLQFSSSSQLLHEQLSSYQDTLLYHHHQPPSASVYPEQRGQHHQDLADSSQRSVA